MYDYLTIIRGLVLAAECQNYNKIRIKFYIFQLIYGTLMGLLVNFFFVIFFNTYFGCIIETLCYEFIKHHEFWKSFECNWHLDGAAVNAFSLITFSCKFPLYIKQK